MVDDRGRPIIALVSDYMSGVPGYDKNKLPIYNKAPYHHIRALYSNTELSSFYDKGIEIVLVPQAKTTKRYKPSNITPTKSLKSDQPSKSEPAKS